MMRFGERMSFRVVCKGYRQTDQAAFAGFVTKPSLRDYFGWADLFILDHAPNVLDLVLRL